MAKMSIAAPSRVKKSVVDRHADQKTRRIIPQKSGWLFDPCANESGAVRHSFSWQIFRLLIVVCLLAYIPPVFSQDLSTDELQVALNSYFDNFNVKIVYPSISLSKKISDSTAVNVRYLVDVISAASMKSHFEIDGVTSATSKEDGGGDNVPDEVRHELGLGFTDVPGGGLIKGGTLSLNSLYSGEHDYASMTVDGTCF